MLELHNVRKAFGDRQVLDNVTMALTPGKLTGFVGSNGAGKTTTMRIIMGLLAPDSGRIIWNGSTLTTEQRRTFGYIPEERGLYPRQPVREQLVYFGTLHLMTSRQAADRADEILEILGLEQRGADKLEDLSLGNQQRAQIAVALMHRPEVLVLDEPFSGLDPEAVDALSGLIRSCSDDGVPVLFSSHQLDLVEKLCDELVILSGGRIVASGTAPALRAGHSTVIRIDAPAVGGWIGDAEKIEVLSVNDGRAEFVPSDAGAADAVLREALVRGPVTHFGEVPVPLSEIYKEVTR
ncbi:MULTISPECIES: ATP-binding cassette domain-containing protein [unclassified Streptomyces]|uniref:ABC transporter ATP-binding protein n=1 Tax=unclassified Streptomyces TaxID=2593676 RepID=UPI002E32688C|nr:ATP-binding cassette domain-containing protein [Streptomyces sp. NBC_01278]